MHLAILTEIIHKTKYLSAPEIKTIYFGGGTPSLFTEKELDAILQQIHKCYNVSPDAEITIEANPDDINTEVLSGWKRIGINRLSIGIQSFVDEELKFMNRAHTANMAEKAVKDAQESGFSNITVDLIYGVPQLGIRNKELGIEDNWEYNLSKLSTLKIPHFSAYALTVEPKTALAHQIKINQIPNLDDALASLQFEILHKWASENGYEHYEISNFCRPGFQSKHNSSYWSGEDYIGVGPSAHSFDGSSRQWNISNNKNYELRIKNYDLGEAYFEKENLTTANRFNEFLMIRLRTKKGFSLVELETKFPEFSAAFQQNALVWIDGGFMILEMGNYSFTLAGWLISDKILAELFEEG